MDNNIEQGIPQIESSPVQQIPTSPMQPMESIPVQPLPPIVETPEYAPPMQETPVVKSSKKKWIFIALGVVVLLFVIGGIVGAMYVQKNEKEDATKVIDSEITNIDKLQTEYKSIVELLRAGRTQDPEKQNSAFSNLLGVQDVRIDETNLEDSQLPAVLGIEDIPAVKVSRSYISKLQQSQRTLGEISDQNNKVETTLNDFMLTKYDEKASPIEDTKTFTEKSTKLLHYFEEMELLTLDFMSWGIDVWTTIQRSIVAGADDASVAKVEESLKYAGTLKLKAAGIDLTGLTDKQRKDHKEFVDSFDAELKPFDAILAALKAKDAVALQKAIIDTTLEGASSVEQGTMSYVTEWQSNELLKGVPDLKTKWEKFAEEFK